MGGRFQKRLRPYVKIPDADDTSILTTFVAPAPSTFLYTIRWGFFFFFFFLGEAIF